ncbi:MAG: hypothetical protein H6Q90_5787 [Deltaproteobacteria bacterium]|nr:hypothetical protein [Deltaproteobacteria bacterium]
MLRCLIAHMLVATLATCGGPNAAVTDARPAEPDAAWRPVFDGFGALETIAGAGGSLANGQNGWSPAFEGGPATAAQLSRPHMAQADAAGIIYIADKEANAIRAVATDGTITTLAGTGAPGDDGDTPGPARERRLSSPNGLWVRGDGTVYLLDLGNDKVRAVDPSGNLRTLFVVGGAGDGRGLWVAADESRAVVAAGTSVKEWTPSGGVRVLAGGFVSLGNLVVTDDGAVLATDRGGHRVYRITPDGQKTPIAGNGTPVGGGDGARALDTGLDQVRGIWLYAGGYFLATHKGGDIWYVDERGGIHLFIRGTGGDITHAGDGERFDTSGDKLAEPRAISVTPAGELLIVENDRGFIRRVRRAD